MAPLRCVILSARRGWPASRTPSVEHARIYKEPPQGVSGGASHGVAGQASGCACGSPDAVPGVTRAAGASLHRRGARDGAGGGGPVPAGTDRPGGVLGRRGRVARRARP